MFSIHEIQTAFIKLFITAAHVNSKAFVSFFIENMADYNHGNKLKQWFRKMKSVAVSSFIFDNEDFYSEFSTSNIFLSFLLTSGIQSLI